MIERLHHAWLQRLRTEWQTVNRDKLGGRLQPPVLTIDPARPGAEKAVRLGHWDRHARILGISERHIWDHPWDEVLETLKHEIAHQAAHELLGATEEVPHGPTFAQACRLVGVSAAATGRPDLQDRSEADRILGKVRKLLALAASPNAHEAETAMAAANTLLLKYNLELTGQADPGYGFRRVGRSAAALPVEWKLVASILSQFFFVECIWVSVYNARRDRQERMLELVGGDTNLELAVYVHDFLQHACDGLWHAQQRALQHKGPTARREFMAGVLMGFQDKLKQERAHNAGRGLVWVGDPELKHWFRDRHPSTRSLTGGGVRRGAAHEAGMEAGRSLRIHKGMHTHGASGKLLTR
jgi:hypothetical protein